MRPRLKSGRACLFAVGFVLGALIGCARGTSPKEDDDMVQEPTITEEETTLRSGDRIERTLQAEGAAAFPLTLDEGDWLELVVTQQGIDVAIELAAPDAGALLAVDSPIGREGEERLVAVARASGEHRVTVRAVEPSAPPGRFVLEVVAIHPATDRERTLAEAEQHFSAAENQRRQGTEASRRAAHERYGQALALWREAGDRRRMADTMHRLGWITDDLGDKKAAKARYEEALELYRQAGDRRGEAMVLNFLGATHYLLGELDEALRSVRAALDLLRSPGPDGLEAPSLVAGCLGNLGKIHRRRGETEKALSAYREALTLAEARDDRQQKATLSSNLGILLLSQDLLDSAEDHLRQAAEAWRALGHTHNQGAIWSRLGDIAKRRAGEAVDEAERGARLSEALAAYERALELKRQAGDERGAAIALDGIATIHLLLEQLDTAERRYQEAREIYGRLELRADETQALVNLGRLHQLRGDFEEALRMHREAEPAVAELGDLQLVASNLYGLARALWSLGRLEEAGKHADELLRIIEDLRASTNRESFQVAFFASKQQYYELAIDIRMGLAQRGSRDALGVAFAASERRRARALLDLLGEERDKIRERAPVQLLARERKLQEELNRQAVATPQAEASIRRCREELDEVRSAIREAVPDDLFGRSSTVDLTASQRLVTGPHTQLLVYALGEERSYLWLVSEDDIESEILPPRRVIEAAADDAYEALQSQSQTRRERNRRRIRNLAELILDPVADRLIARRLVIVADGALLDIPFAALPKSDASSGEASGEADELIRSHEIVHLPSVSVLQPIRRRLGRRGVAPALLVIFADPRFSHPGNEPVGDGAGERHGRSLSSFGWKPLPGTRQEAEAIQAVARGEVRSFLGAEATKEMLLTTDLSRFQILHLATHGLIHRDHPELSGLVFSLFDAEGRPLDGHLRLHEIYNLDLDAELVVLSACGTALGRRVRGEGILGLSRAFFYAGSSRLVISHWNVGDMTTMELMRRFYWALLELGTPPAAALRAAQMSMLESGDPQLSLPRAWAGFTFQGDWRLSGSGDDPIEGAATGDTIDEGTDIDYPTPDDEHCASLDDPWQQEVCLWLQKLASGAGDGP